MTESGEWVLEPGMCAGFPAKGEAHHLVNRTNRDVVILEIGDRARGDEVTYPVDDLRAVMRDDGRWIFHRRMGALTSLGRAISAESRPDGGLFRDSSRARSPPIRWEYSRALTERLGGWDARTGKCSGQLVRVR